jgi:hypothetical protein
MVCAKLFESVKGSICHCLLRAETLEMTCVEVVGGPVIGESVLKIKPVYKRALWLHILTTGAVLYEAFNAD